jgi:hypothetical protein
MNKRPEPGTRIEHDDGVNPPRRGTVEECDLSTMFAYTDDEGHRHLCLVAENWKVLKDVDA